MPLVLPGTTIFLALTKASEKAFTVEISGLGLPADTASPKGACAKSISEFGTILFSAMRSIKPSRDKMTTSAVTPAASCALIVLGPEPCDAPDLVITLMPYIFSKAGSI